MTRLPDWDTLTFRFYPTEWMYRASGDTGKDPVWEDGAYLPFADIPMSPAAAFLSYACGVFEGLKAERGADGRIRLFRPRDHAARFNRSAERLAMPSFPPDRFVEVAAGVTARNLDFVPPAGKGSFYLRPMMHGVEPMLGLSRVRGFAVTVYGSPVGPYFAGRDGVGLHVVRFGRAAPGGTGRAKAAGNYPGVTKWRELAAAGGYDDVLFLDAEGKGLIGETSGSNFFCLLDDGELATPPLDDTILAGITRDSAMRIARDVLGVGVAERPLSIDEVLARGREAFCTGTGWTVRPVIAIGDGKTRRAFASPDLSLRIREILRGIQSGARPDPFAWTVEVEAGATRS
ncbi:MAG: branched-chain-amino-acid transaminase [Planctomycetes bacterium]|nr:branched-chain-amino-acid transaminase [Planctomycetota bacterium]